MKHLLAKILGFHLHYWGVPHPVSDEDTRLIVTCYDCSTDRPLKVELRPR